MIRLCVQQTVFHQEFPGNLFHGAAFHIHGVGHIGHFFVVHGAAEQAENIPEIGRYIRHLFKEAFPYQQGAVVLREEIAVILQYLELRLPVEAIGGVHLSLIHI